MEVTFAEQALDHIDWWKRSGNKQVLTKISELIQSIQTTPFDGIGKPEPLKHNLSGAWSRRINGEHRIVYEVHEDAVKIISLKGHY